MDISVSFPSEGRIRLRSRFLFQDPQGEHCRRFVERVSVAEGVQSVTVRGGGRLTGAGEAEIFYCPKTYSRQQATAAIYSRLVNGNTNGHANGYGHNGNGQSHANGNGHGNGRNGHGHESRSGVSSPSIHVTQRHASFAFLRRLKPGRIGAPETEALEGSGWKVLHKMPGRIRFHNACLHRKKDLCQAIERELMSVLGVDNYKTNALTGTVLILYDARQLNQSQLVEILDSALAQAEVPGGEGQGRPAASALHVVGSTGGGGAVPGSAALAGRRGAFPVQLDPDVSRGTRGPLRGATAGRGRSRRDRRGRLPGHLAGLPRGRALLVPRVRPGPGQEDAGRLQEALDERLRQAAAVRLALPRRPGGAGRARSSSSAAT